MTNAAWHSAAAPDRAASLKQVQDKRLENAGESNSNANTAPCLVEPLGNIQSNRAGKLCSNAQIRFQVTKMPEAIR
jgi:hypothetical protein